MIEHTRTIWTQNYSCKRAFQGLHGLCLPKRHPSRVGHPTSAPRAGFTPWVALTLLGVVFAVTSEAFSVIAATPSPLVPDQTLTPGDVLTTDPTVVCQRGYTATVRDVPQSLKNQVYRQYGMALLQNSELTNGCSLAGF